ncbi:MAG: Ribosomal RNA large subunit methyltransferase H [Chlamydiia bacterium]|nr:Ribosomal RNA large subunit methyltransferase H [Chlamydiia bacterium]
MRFKIKVYCVGRAHRGWLKEALETYEKRLTSRCLFEWVIVKSGKELKEKLSSLSYFCLDPLGKSHTSESFSNLIENKVSWNFVIGGAEGLCLEVKQNAQGLISFSKMTFPHEFVRLLIIEQIYRAIEITNHTPYHK